MYVLQHTRQVGGIAGGIMPGVDLAVHGRGSVASSMSSMSEQEPDTARHGQHGHHGPYMEGNMKLLATVECPTDVMCNRFSDDGTLLAVGLINGTVKVYMSMITMIATVIMVVI